MYAVDNVFELLTDGGYLKFGPGNSDDPDWAGLIGPGGVTTSVDLRESRSNLARTDGEVIGPSYWGNRTVVMDILIPEPDPAKRGQIINRIYKACSALRAPDFANEGMYHLQWTEQDGQIHGTNPLVQYTLDDPESEFYATPEDEWFNPATYYGTPKRLPVKLQAYPTIAHNGDPTKSIQIVLTALQPFIESNFNYLYDPFVVGAEFETGTTSYYLDPDLGPSTVKPYPIIRIATPIRSFTIESQDGSFSFENGTALDSGGYLWIDCRPDRRTVIHEFYVGSTLTRVNLYDKVAVGSVFPSVQPLEITDIVGASSGSTEFEMRYWWAWL
jgi:hypothetical protein